MENIVIYGAGGFAREVFQLIEDINKKNKLYNFLGFVQDNSKNLEEKIYGFPILDGMNWLEKHKETLVVIGIGNTCAKRKIAMRLEEQNINSPVLIHPNVIAGRNVEFGKGSIICASNVITVDIKIGMHVILNLDCTVGHDAIIEDFSTVAPGSHISGNVHIGQGTDVGTGSSIIQGMQIGAWSVLGAGAVVSKNIPDNVTAVGVPARPVKEREPGWHLL
jgi:sugar O-acyltransferase (sialic acid O-acetyltransferase NeuD family)